MKKLKLGLKLFNTLKLMMLPTLALVVILPLVAFVSIVESSVPVVMEFQIPQIEFSYNLAEVPLLNYLMQYELPQEILGFVGAIFSSTLSIGIFLIKNTIFQFAGLSIIIVLSSTFLLFRYLAYREKLFSITPDLNEVLRSKRHRLHVEAALIKKKRVASLFKEIFRIESLKNGFGDRS